MENKNQENQDVNQKLNQESNERETKKKFSMQAIIVPVIIAVILIAFAGVVFYANVLKPASDLDKKIGYNAEDYIQLDKYTGFDYEITQDMFDECVREETDSYEEVDRAAQDTDQIDFNYTGYVDGKKDSNISQKDAELILGEDATGAFKVFAEAISGHKSGDTIKDVKVEGADVTELSADESDYSGKNVTFTIKINNVSKHVTDEITDKWVKENYLDEYGLETASDFYNWCKEYLEDEAKTEVWQKVLDKTTMSSYPQEVYDNVVTTFTEDANYNADQFGITTDEYLKDFCGYTDETLEEEYINEVKSELVMWYIVKKQKFECTKEEIETKYEELYLDIGYENVDEMKAEYSESEIEEVVLLEKVQNYVYENSNIKETFKIPEK